MRSIKKAQKNNIQKNIIYLLIGIFLFIFPNFISNSICYIIGSLTSIIGLICLINYFKLKKHNNNSVILLILGLLILGFGLSIIIKPNIYISIIPFIIGIYIIFIALYKLNQALILKNSKYNKWYSFMLSAILMLLFGIIITFNPFETITLIIRLIGLTFIITSIYDIYNNYNYKKGTKDLKKDINKLFE